jgi:hypothetical protein
MSEYLMSDPGVFPFTYTWQIWAFGTMFVGGLTGAIFGLALALGEALAKRDK